MKHEDITLNRNLSVKDSTNTSTLHKESILSLLNSYSALTMVVSVIEPKLLMKILQVTFTGGPEKKKNRWESTPSDTLWL